MLASECRPCLSSYSVMCCACALCIVHAPVQAQMLRSDAASERIESGEPAFASALLLQPLLQTLPEPLPEPLLQLPPPPEAAETFTAGGVAWRRLLRIVP